MAGYESVGSLGTVSNPFTVTTVAGSGASTIAVEGTAASGAADSGYPVKIGGRYTIALPTFTNNQRGDIQISQRGQIRVVYTDDNANTVAIAGNGSDAQALGAFYGLLTTATNFVFNGATWDRARGDTNGAYTVEKNRAVFFTNAPSQTLAAAGVFTGAARDVGVAPGAVGAYARYGVFVNASQAGTLTVQGSDDNFATSFVAATQAVAAATPLDVSIPVRARYYRAVFTNGATAQTAIVIKDGYGV